MPSGTSSLAVGGWIGPMSIKRRIISDQPQYLPTIDADGCSGQQQLGNDVCFLAEQGVQNVAAVELPDRDQVECRDEDADPAGERDRMEHDVLGRTKVPEGQVRQAFE